MNKNKNLNGFTLTELLVVVAILGVIASVGVLSYTGYVASAERKSAENLMQQISLGQSEFLSDNGVYYSVTESECTPSQATLSDIFQNLLGTTTAARATQKAADSAYAICISQDNSGEAASNTDYLIIASNGTLVITMNSEGEVETNDAE